MTVKYEPESKKALVSEIKNVGPHLINVATKAKKLMVDLILNEKKKL